MKLLNLLKNNNYPSILAADLSEFTGKMNKKQALHFLRRLTFHPTPEQINQIIGKTPAEAYEIVLGDGNTPEPQPTTSMNNWLNKLEENPLDDLPLDIRFQIEGIQKTHYNELLDWWLVQMKNSTFPEVEKFTLFLSTIWTIEFTYDTEALIPAPLLFRNNATLRKLRFSSYKDIASAMTLDGAMLLYQSLFYSGGSAPNENYMRELMELFTMGIGDLDTGAGNYTEADIREGSKALTGWRTVAYLGQPGAPANKPFETFFVRDLHDKGGKKLFQFGQIAPITDDENTQDLVKAKEVDGLMDILFTERGMSIARFVSEKILRYFCYSNPTGSDINIINQLAQYFYDNNFELGKLYKKLFTSNFFFSEELYGCQIKTPTEFLIGLQNMFGKDLDKVQSGKTRKMMNTLEQVLYDPPNVGSWKAYRTWINTNTYPLRVQYANEYLEILTDNELIDFAKKFEDFNNFESLFTNLISYFLPIDISMERINDYKVLLANGISTTDWATAIESNDAKVAQGLRNFVKRMFATPDFQLC